MTPLKDTIKLLQRNWETISLELWKTNNSLKMLSNRKEQLLSQLDGLLKTFDLLGQRPGNLIIPTELIHKPNASIGEVMEKLLKESGPMTRTALIERLRQTGRLNTKNARVILANAIKRDTRKRFAEKDGKVFLNEK